MIMLFIFTLRCKFFPATKGTQMRFSPIWNFRNTILICIFVHKIEAYGSKKAKKTALRHVEFRDVNY
jgi:hypothetical protein